MFISKLPYQFKKYLPLASQTTKKKISICLTEKITDSSKKYMKYTLPPFKTEGEKIKFNLSRI